MQGAGYVGASCWVGTGREVGVFGSSYLKAGGFVCLMRYARQQLIIGDKGQAKLAGAHVVVVGCGALGSVSCELLARAGIGQLTLIDRDLVEETNLQRQALYTEHSIGKPKVLEAKRALLEINSTLKITTHFEDLSYKNVDLLEADIIVDGTDNLQTRFLLNEYAKKNGRTWVYGSAIGRQGYVQLLKEKCFSCYQKPANLPTCETAGVFGSVTHIVGSLQAQLVIDYLATDVVDEKLRHITVSPVTIDILDTPKSKDCLVCSQVFDYLDGKGYEITKTCGGTYHVSMDYDYESLKSTLDCEDLGFGLKCQDLTVLPDGRVLVKAESEKEAISKAHKVIGA